MLPDKQNRYSFITGDHVLARVKKDSNGVYIARTIKKVRSQPSIILGVINFLEGKYQLLPVEKRNRQSFIIDPSHLNGSKLGDLVTAKILPKNLFGTQQVKVTSHIKSLSDSKSLGYIALEQFDIPYKFSKDSLKKTNSFSLEIKSKKNTKK